MKKGGSSVLVRFYKGEWLGKVLPLKDSPEILEFLRQAWAHGDVFRTVQSILSYESLWAIDLATV